MATILHDPYSGREYDLDKTDEIRFFRSERAALKLLPEVRKWLDENGHADVKCWVDVDGAYSVYSYCVYFGRDDESGDDSAYTTHILDMPFWFKQWQEIYDR